MTQEKYFNEMIKLQKERNKIIEKALFSNGINKKGILELTKDQLSESLMGVINATYETA